jgi:hypothetical protein
LIKLLWKLLQKRADEFIVFFLGKLIAPKKHPFIGVQQNSFQNEIRQFKTRRVLLQFVVLQSHRLVI